MRRRRESGIINRGRGRRKERRVRGEVQRERKTGKIERYKEET